MYVSLICLYASCVRRQCIEDMYGCYVMCVCAYRHMCVCVWCLCIPNRMVVKHCLSGRDLLLLTAEQSQPNFQWGKFVNTTVEASCYTHNSFIVLNCSSGLNTSPILLKFPIYIYTHILYIIKFGYLLRNFKIFYHIFFLLWGVYQHNKHSIMYIIVNIYVFMYLYTEVCLWLQQAVSWSEPLLCSTAIDIYIAQGTKCIHSV